MNSSIERNFKRIPYGENENQFGDLRLPKGDGPFPVAIVIHGGFWREKFELEHMNKFVEALTAKGIATWNIEYCRVGQEGGGWPGTFLDSAKATDFVRTLAKSYPLDVNRVVTIGHSAGGHLALWLAARHKLPPNSTLQTSKHPLHLKGVISLAGVSDLALMHDIHQWKETIFGIIDNPTRDLMGGLPKDLQSRYEEGSPMALLPIGVPLVLIHGSLDVNVPIGISEHFEKVAKSAGDTVSFIPIPAAEHFKLIVPDSEVWPVILESSRNLLNN
ncbi:alpha/beta hydrolase family protein [Pseudalkalibacillus sp. A8]|uniref:alpha/beta hydrolase family protein n=1 Tax=Pseudalkalibacillus sp. A8 TaxID=3382641 RepID=UPI0038B57625